MPVSVTPNAGSGNSQAFSFVYSDPKGYAAISSVSAIINGSLSGTGGCYFLYYPGANFFYLANDAGTAWLGPVAFGSATSLQNSQCTVDVGGASSSGSGSNLTINLAVTFKLPFSGTKKTYLDAIDGYTLDSGWQQKGTWTVPGGAPTLVSATPSSGSGSSTTFSFLYSDAKGYASITTLADAH